jgi:hypothetical protein
MSRTHDVMISAFDLDRLEAELSAAIEQRDRLAEALRKIDNARLNQFAGPHDMALTCVLIARETLASVKGGNDES